RDQPQPAHHRDHAEGGEDGGRLPGADAMRILIIAVPRDMDRVWNAKRLSEQTGGDIVWDRTKNIMDTFVSVLDEAGDDAALVVQDDVQLRDDWHPMATQAVEEHGEMLIQFFSIRASDVGRESYRNNASGYMMNQCYYLPRAMAAEAAEAARPSIEVHPGPTGSDACIQYCIRHARMHSSHRGPSMLQHRTSPPHTGKERSPQHDS